VFTLGSSAIYAADNFYVAAAEAARAQAMAVRMRQEPGAAGAADAIEALLVRSGRVSPVATSA
jgi:hypothetical protein